MLLNASKVMIRYHVTHMRHPSRSLKCVPGLSSRHHVKQLPHISLLLSNVQISQAHGLQALAALGKALRMRHRALLMSRRLPAGASCTTVHLHQRGLPAFSPLHCMEGQAVALQQPALLTCNNHIGLRDTHNCAGEFCCVSHCWPLASSLVRSHSPLGRHCHMRMGS